MRRFTRYAAVAAALACALTLAACDKPAPKITIQSGTVSAIVSPTSYAFDASHLKTYAVSLPEISAKTDATVLIDVPRQVANAGWAVNALSLDTTHKSLGGSGAIKGRHSYRVAAQTNSGSPFIVQVGQLRNGKPDGSVWNFLVKVSDAT